MELLKQSLKIAIVLFALSTLAQEKNLMKAFSQSYEYEYNKNYDAAIATLVSNYSETSYETNLRLGWLNYMSGRYKESIAYYQKAIALYPAATEPIWAIITPYTVLEKWNDVEKSYQAIIRLDPKNSSAHYQLGMIYYYRKDYVSAKKYFDISLNLYPFDYNNMLMSAWTNFFLGNKNDARIIFNKVLLYSPNDKSALEGLSYIK
ncbi:MAG: tetratricopeptide repeat protein [Bacteroidota bacterium]|nr:tetratricopeptide repeat protein [Bacteroidota bacterium]